VDELADAVLRELPPVARTLDPPEGQARVRLHEAVHEHRARLDLRRQALGARAVPRPERGTKTKGRVIGEANGIGLVLRPDHGGDGPEGLFVEGWHALVHSRQQGRRVEGSLARRNLAAQQELGPALDRLPDLPVPRVPEADTSPRPACSATLLPARSLPVNVAATMRGSAMSAATAGASTSTVEKSPRGKPASRKTASIASAQRGTFEACLRMAASPAIRAGAAK